MIVSRRAVLAGLGMTSAAMFVPGVLSWVAAQKNPKRQILIQVLNEASGTGDMQAALERNGKYLADSDKKILMSLTREELGYLGSFRRKLSRLGVLVPG